MKAETLLWAVVVLGIIYIGWEVIEPFLSVLFFAAVSAYAVYPIHRCMKKNLGSVGSALSLTSLTIGLGALMTAALVLISAKVASSFYNGIVDFLDWLLQQPLPPEILRFIQNFYDQFIPMLSEMISKQALSLPWYLLQLFVFFLAFYYFLAYADEIVERLYSLLPETNRRLGEELIQSIDKTLSALVRAWFLLNFAKGLLMTVGFLAFQVSDLYTAIVAGFLTLIFSFIPLFEGWMIWLIAAAYFVIQGMYWHAVGIAVYGFVLVSPLPDYTIRPMLVAKDTELDETLVFIGMIGGTWAMGIKGLIIGPIVLNLLLVLLKEWERVNSTRKTEEPSHRPSPFPSGPSPHPPS
jgi:predicted PurR-regulated permease PerM